MPPLLTAPGSAQSLLPAPIQRPRTPTAVQPADFQVTAQGFVHGQQTLISALSTLAASLNANTAAIGRDRSGNKFSGSYRAAAGQATVAVCSLVAMLGSIAQGLCKAGTDHSRGDAISVQGWRATNFQTLTIQPEPPPLAPAIGDITGYVEPGLPEILDDLWPCKNQSKVDAIAAAWRTACTAIQDTQTICHAALTTLVHNNQGDDLAVLESFWARFSGGPTTIFSVLNDAFLAISLAVAEYAAMVDRLDTALKEAVNDAIDEAEVELGVVLVLDVFTDGLAAVFTSQEAEVISERAAGHLLPVLNQLLTELDASPNYRFMTDRLGGQLRDAVAVTPTPNLAGSAAWQAGDDVDQRGQWSEEEKKVVTKLGQDGHVVRQVVPGNLPQNPRTPDTLTDGEPVEIKSPTPTGNGNDDQIYNMLLGSAHGKRGTQDSQAPEIVLDARETGITAAQARDQIDRFYFGTHPGTDTQRVTVWLRSGEKVTYPPGYAGL
jgi:hypothetical protein